MTDFVESQSAHNAESQVKRRKQKAIMKPAEDVLLLKEAVAIFPWGLARNERGAAWKSIADAVNLHLDKDRHLDARRARERVSLLMDKHKVNELDSLRASGTDEEYSEREQLLIDLDEMVNNSAMVTKASGDEKKEQERQGEFLRQAAMETLKQKSASAGDGFEVDDSTLNDSGESSRLPKLKPRKKSRISEVEMKLESFIESEQESRKQEIALLEKSQMMEEGRQGLENRRLALEEKRAESERLDQYNQQQQILQLMSLLAPNSHVPK